MAMATMETAATGSMFGGLSRLFVDRKINTKIAFGFGCVLLITAVSSFLAYCAFGTVAASFESYAQRVQSVSAAREIDREFLAFLRPVREFAFTGAEANVEAAVKSRETLQGALSRGVAQ